MAGLRRNQLSMSENQPVGSGAWGAGGAAAATGVGAGIGAGSAGRDALDRGFLPRLLRFFLHLLDGIGLLGLPDEIEAQRQRLALVQVVVAQALDRVVRRFEMAIRNEQHVDLESRLDRQHFGSLFVQQERRDVDRNLRDDLRGVLLHRLFLQDAQDVERARFGAADVADAVAARTRDVGRLGERRAQPLARQLHQAEARDLAELHAGAVVAQRVLQAGLDFALVLGALHVDEIDDDESAQVAQAELAGDFVGGFEIGVERRRLDVAAPSSRAPN